MLGVLLIGMTSSMAQTAAPKFVLCTVEGFQVEAAEIKVRPDKGDVVSVKLRADTQVQRVGAGETDLKKAEPIKITDVSSGDRVLVNLMPGAFEARRIVVMASTDIAKRNEADRLDWTRRGVLGIVASKKGSEVTLRMRSMQGEKIATVTVKEATSYRRYAPDSVKFADAKPSALAEVNVGDQLRARGQKSEDGLKVTADEVVFGTFLTKAGPITAVNVEGKEITVKDLTTGKPLVVKFSADSQVKTLPNLAAMFGGTTTTPAPATAPPAVAGATRSGMRPPGGGAPDLTQMLERMPSTRFEDLKVGDTIVVSSTKGANAGQITAITLVANAGFLIQMATAQSGAAGAGRPGGAAGAGGGMGGGMMGGMMGGGAMGGMGGLDLGGMTP